jgi:hypothetical protein
VPGRNAGHALDPIVKARRKAGLHRFGGRSRPIVADRGRSRPIIAK